jgi:hypothetical protein
MYSTQLQYVHVVLKLKGSGLRLQSQDYVCFVIFPPETKQAVAVLCSRDRGKKGTEFFFAYIPPVRPPAHKWRPGHTRHNLISPGGTVAPVFLSRNAVLVFGAAASHLVVPYSARPWAPKIWTGRGFACTIPCCRLDPNLHFIFHLIFACLLVFSQGPMCAEASLYVAFPFFPGGIFQEPSDHPCVSDDDVDDFLYQVLHEPQGSAIQVAHDWSTSEPVSTFLHANSQCS